ncbi:substrate-binding domain-containing protein, partial [Moorena sp. SIO3I6]|uniref:substrate-binding domain-containing protein n=1 Tax=Moorena sp. SIO3I6 TaxID=2607831 RepID=UPI0013F9CE0C
MKLFDKESGFHTNLEVTGMKFEPIEGFLPAPPPALNSSFANWQLSYRGLDDVKSCFSSRLTAGKVVNYSAPEEAQAVKAHLNEWLNSGDREWQPIRDQLISIANQSQANQSNPAGQEIHVLLDVPETNLSRFPWQEWDVFKNHYPNAEVILRIRNPSSKTIIPPQNSSKLRILVVVGRSDGINTESDLEVIQELEKKGVEVITLIQPSFQELYQALFESYQIFIFTGHSSSQEDGKIGWIELNNQDSVTIKQLSEPFKKAIDNGLQLAIFNSCDGIGLANQLTQLNLLQCIVMREPVPDVVAVAFLKYFFKEFTANKSLFISVHEARNRLGDLNEKYPGVIWLPILCIRESALYKPFTLQGMMKKPLLKPKIRLGFILLLLLLLSFSIFLIIKMTRGKEPIVNPTPTNNPTNSQESILTDVNTPPGTFPYGGSTTWAKIRRLVDDKIKQKFPQFNLVYTEHIRLPPGSGTGIQMLLDGQISFSQSSRPIQRKEHQIANQMGVTLKQIPVAIGGMAVVVHPKLDIKGLTLEQLKGIYTGKLTNWQQVEVDGPNLKITPYSAPRGAGGTVILKEHLLERGQDFGPNVIFTKTPTEAINKVGNLNNEGDDGGIYMASVYNLVGQCSVKPVPIARTEDGPFVAPYEGELVPIQDCPDQRNKLNYKVFQNSEYPIT